MTWVQEVDPIVEEVHAVRDALVAQDVRRAVGVRRHDSQARINRMNSVLAGQDTVEEALRAAAGTEVSPDWAAEPITLATTPPHST
ncbi:MAG: hypothetical protein EA416_05635 [Trueperaceae bacterium]|nr:MAG: hypothetical protein EA416_05635 [Trueperaceae bacterium]